MKKIKVEICANCYACGLVGEIVRCKGCGAEVCLDCNPELMSYCEDCEKEAKDEVVR